MDYSLPRAQEQANFRTTALSIVAGTFALAGSIGGILASVNHISASVWLAISGAVLSFGVLSWAAYRDFTGRRRDREVVVNLISTTIHQDKLAGWINEASIRGVLEVFIIDDSAVRVAVLPVRYGQVISSDTAPVVTLRALVQDITVKHFAGYELRFTPEFSDWKPQVDSLYDREDLADALFDAKERNESLGNPQLRPEAVIYTENVSDQLPEFLRLSQSPDDCFRIEFSSDVERHSPSLFNVLNAVEVSVSGYPSLLKDVSRTSPSRRAKLDASNIDGSIEAIFEQARRNPPPVTEDFAIFGYLEPKGRVAQFLHYSARVRIPFAG